MESLGRKLRMCLVEASDGLRIVLFGPMDADIDALQRSFVLLSRDCGYLQLERQRYVAAFGGVRILLQCSVSPKGASNHASRKGLFKNTNDPFQFEWTLSAEDWDDLAAMIYGLVSSDDVGHQYLTRHPQDDATLVVSRGEYSDEILKEYDGPDSYGS